MQKTAYPVRTRQAIEGRTALGLLREMQTGGRALTTRPLHKTWLRDAITLFPCTVSEHNYAQLRLPETLFASQKSSSWSSRDHS
jgi:hypothetical protein